MESRRVLLKWAQGVLCAATVVLALGTFIPLGYVTRYFGSRCVLYSNPAVTVSANRTVLLQPDWKWGPDDVCEFITFIPVFAAIHGFIWCWFFFHMYRLLKQEGNELYLSFPVLFMHAALFVCTIVSSILLSLGNALFCEDLTASVSNKYSCDELQNLGWKVIGRQVYFTSYLRTAEGSSWLMTLTIGAQVVVTFVKTYIELFPAGKKDKINKSKECDSIDAVDSETGSIHILVAEPKEVNETAFNALETSSAMNSSDSKSGSAHALVV